MTRSRRSRRPLSRPPLSRPSASRPVRRVAPLLAAAALLVTVGCGDDDPVSSSPEAEETPTITIVTYSSYVLDDEVKAAVERDLGVKLEVNATGDGAEALSAAILTAGRPEGDIFFGVDNTLLSRAIAGEVFAETSLDDLPNLAGIPDELRLDDTGRLVPVDVGPVCVDYDQQWFADQGLEPPATLEDLTDPQYRDLLVVESPVTSSTGLVFLMGTHAALGDGADQFWKDLVANGVSVAGSWDDAWNAQYTVNGGDRPLVVSYASSPPVEVVYSDGALTEPRSGVIEATCTDQIEFAGVLRGTDHPDEAAAVLDAMLGETWQASLPLANFVYPARTGVDVPEEFATWAPRPADSITLDPDVIDANRDEWVEEWRAIAE